MKQAGIVSVGITACNSIKKTEEYLATTHQLMVDAVQSFEIILIGNECSQMSQLISKYSNVRYFALQSRITQDECFFMILENAIGDYIITLNGERESPGSLENFFKALKPNTTLLSGYYPRERTDSFFQRILSTFFTLVVRRLTGYSMHPRIADACCYSRKVSSIIQSMAGRSNNHRVARYQTNVPIEYVEIPFYSEKDSSTYDSRMLFNRLLAILSLKSNRLLIIAASLCLGTAFLGLTVSLYALASKLFLNEITSGWTSLMILNGVSFSSVFCILGLICMYLWIALNKMEVKASLPTHTEHRSDALTSMNFKNVVKHNPMEPN